MHKHRLSLHCAAGVVRGSCNEAAKPSAIRMIGQSQRQSSLLFFMKSGVVQEHRLSISPAGGGPLCTWGGDQGAINACTSVRSWEGAPANLSCADEARAQWSRAGLQGRHRGGLGVGCGGEQQGVSLVREAQRRAVYGLSIVRPTPGTVRGMAKGRPSSKGSSKQQSEVADPYQVGKEISLFTCPVPWRFRMMTSAAVTYVTFSSWVYYEHYYGTYFTSLGAGTMPTIYGIVVHVGLFMSLLGSYLVYQNASRHVCRLSVVPGKVVDDLHITTHTVLGGEQTKKVLLLQIDTRAKYEESQGKVPMFTPWQRFKLHGEYGFYLLDDSGKVHDREAIMRVLSGQPLPKARRP